MGRSSALESLTVVSQPPSRPSTAPGRAPAGGCSDGMGNVSSGNLSRPPSRGSATRVLSQKEVAQHTQNMNDWFFESQAINKTVRPSPNIGALLADARYRRKPVGNGR